MKLSMYVTDMYKKIHGKFQKNSLCNLGEKLEKEENLPF